jgi:hypothetical protein
MSRPSEKVVFRVKTESEYQENQLAAFQIGLHHLETHTLIKHTDMNAGHFASCKRYPQTVPKAGSGYLASLHLCASAPSRYRKRMITLCSNFMKSGKILNIYNNHRKMASFSRTERKSRFGLHIMKLILINDFDDLGGWIRRS